MIQFKKIPLSKSAIILLLFLTTTTTGFLRNNEDDHRTTRDDGNVREILLSMDRREENVQVQNLPIRKLNINRDINEKDSIAERLYDRRSFRTGTIDREARNFRSLEDQQQNVLNRDRSADTNRASRNIRINVRDVNNNRRDVARLNIRDDRRSATLREDRRQARETLENRRTTDRAVISRNRDDERRLLNIRTDDRQAERRIVPENRVFVSRLAPDSNDVGFRNVVRAARRTIDQPRHTNESQRRSLDLTARNIRTGERREVLTKQIEGRRMTVRESNLKQTDNRRFVHRDNQRRSIRENNANDRVESREILNRQRDVTRRSLVGRRSTEARNVDQIRSLDRQRTERLERSNSRELRELDVADRRRTVESRDDGVSRQARARFIREQSQADYRSSTRYSERQNRRSIVTRGLDQTGLLENRRITSQSLEHRDRRFSEARTAGLLNRQRSADRLERSVYARNSLDSSVDRQRSLERREDNTPREMPTRFFREQSERDALESRRTTRLAERQHSSSGRRGVEQSRLSTRLRSTRHEISREFDPRRNSLHRRDLDRRESRITRGSRVRYVRDDSRSDSTRNIRDSIPFRRSARQDTSRLSRAAQKDIDHNRHKSSTSESHVTDRYDQLLADSRRYFEKLVSQRITRDSTRDAQRASLESVRNVDQLNMKVDSNMWANTARVVLMAFLIGQIFVHSSKQNKFRFQNILSMATSIKEKVQ